jgi:hypothetical protein
MTVAVFKGRRDVDVHMFRSAWDPAEEETLDWAALIAPPAQGQAEADAIRSRGVILEAFTDSERKTIAAFLQATYPDRLTRITSTPLSLPLPAGLAPLSSARPGKSVGLIDFARIPVYSLGVPLKGLYDLSLHQPIIKTPETGE